MGNNGQVSVVVTGLGATTPLGGDVASTWAAMLAGTCGVRTLTEHWVETVPVTFAAHRRGGPGRPSSAGCRRADWTAASSSRWSRPARPGPTPGRPEVEPERLGVVVATGIGGIGTTARPPTTR